jgi:hypothetical protein
MIYVMNVVNGARPLHIDFAVHDSFAGIGPLKLIIPRRLDSTFEHNSLTLFTL